ncbi:MAG: carboxylating nicotinate-nucleotide diphosphorylase [Ignavibacteriales bacterium]|nr:carboxylating nicotinate-nucleotide diphosphorylase [Ignavibacteriales bacterium]
MKHQKKIDKIIKSAFKEDIGSGDITTIATISKSIKSDGRFIAKEDGIVAGLEIVKRVFDLYDKKLKFKTFFQNGDAIKKGDIIAIVSGSASSILTSERTALNFLQRMSGIASYANKFSEIIKHTNAKVIDTRKTVPGLRILDKLAVSYGGCQNHRIGLYDMFLIKDNHIAAAGSILNAVHSCIKLMKKKNKKFKIEVETENLEKVAEALEAKADIIMLDNFDIDKMAEAVQMINGKAKIEASGGVTLDSVKQIAETGVDFISVGALTHSVKALDISLELENRN